MNKYALMALICFALFTTSCDENRVFESHEDLALFRWYQDDRVAFDVTIEDSEPKNVAVILRHNFYFQWRNIWTNVIVTTPDGTVIETPTNLLLSPPDGEWFADCAGDICDFTYILPEFSNYSFPDTGVYHFEILQEMREDPLPNIMSVGLRIENIAEE